MRFVQLILAALGLVTLKNMIPTTTDGQARAVDRVAPASRTKVFFAEVFGTFFLTFGGCGSAILATGGASGGIGTLGVSLAFGLSVMIAALTFGAYSGGHFNPAVSFAMALSGRLPWRKIPGYWIAQVIGAVAAAFCLLLVASGQAKFSLDGGFAANGFGMHSPAGFGLQSAIVMEVIVTAMFILTILAVTGSSAVNAAAPLAIGAMLTLVHLVLIPITNASVNPARSTSQALVVGGWAIEQLWVFWVAPLAGAWLAAFIYRRFERRAF